MKNTLLREREKMLTKGGIAAFVLNKVKGHAKRRLLALVEHYQNLERLLPQIISAKQRRVMYVISGPYDGARICSLGARKQGAESLKKINRLLARYRVRKEVEWNVYVRSDITPSITTGTYPADSSPSEETKTITRGWTDGEEYWAVENIIELAEMGELHRLRKCPVCPLWYMAPRPDQECCSARCRLERIRSRQTPAERSAYMRDYRIGNTGTKAERERNRARLLKEYRPARSKSTHR